MLGKTPALPPIDKIVASHAMIHTAEGELWRALFTEALAACGVAVRRTTAGTLPARAHWLDVAGKALGSPWTAEIKAAAIAALIA